LNATLKREGRCENLFLDARAMKSQSSDVDLRKSTNTFYSSPKQVAGATFQSTVLVEYSTLKQK
jgi:hypothetical protein